MAIFKKLALCVLLLTAFVFSSHKIEAEVSVCPYTAGSQECVNYYEERVGKTKTQANSLAGQITSMDSQIALTTAQISLTEEKLIRVGDDISSASAKIVGLEDALTHTSEVLVNRIITTYKQDINDPLIITLASNSLGDITQRLSYLKIIQKHDRALMVQMALSKKNYRDQKDLLLVKKKQVEELKKQLKSYQVQLDTQRKEKQSLLLVTRNDEARYQRLLDDARKELEAIKLSQFTGKRDVKKGDVVGLMGSTGFSTGPHLHFGVYSLSEKDAANFSYAVNTHNPLDFLKKRNLTVASGACLDKLGSADLGGGGWDWPMANPNISQCFGKTPFSFVYANGRHDGLDMYDSKDIAVHAVEDGAAYFYRGNTAFGNNVRIFHSNGKMTLYLHLQ